MTTRPPPPRRRPWHILAAAASVLAFLIALAPAKGPFWLGPNLDPDYPYLFNGLLIATGRAAQHVDHPGTPVQLLVAAVLRAFHPLAGNAALIDHVLDRPEFFLQVTRALLLAGVFAALLAAGLLTARATGRTGAGLFVAASPLLTPMVLREALCVKPEPVLLMTGILLGAMSLLAAARGARLVSAAAMGALAALAVTAKVTALPLLILPLLILRTWRLRALYLLALLAVAAIVLIPAYPQLGQLWKITHAIATSPGRYGNPDWPAAGPAGNAVALLQHLAETPILLLAALLCAVTAWRRRRDPRTPDPANACAPFAIVLFLQVLLESTHPYEARYLLPGVALAGPALIAAAWGLRPRLSAAWAGPSARRLGAAAMSAIAAVSVGLVYTGFTHDQAALAVDQQLLDQHPTAQVLEFYRASTPAFAQSFGNLIAGDHFGQILDSRDPDRVFFSLWLHQFSGYQSPLPTTYALTTHLLILRGATPDVYPPLLHDVFFQHPLLAPGNQPPLDGLYGLRLPPETELAFGDFIAQGLHRPTPLLHIQGAPFGRIVDRLATLTYAPTPGQPQRLEAAALSPDGRPVTLHVRTDTRELAAWLVPAGNTQTTFHCDLPPAAAPLVRLTLQVDGPSSRITFTRLHILPVSP